MTLQGFPLSSTILQAFNKLYKFLFREKTNYRNFKKARKVLMARALGPTNWTDQMTNILIGLEYVAREDNELMCVSLIPIRMHTLEGVEVVCLD